MTRKLRWTADRTTEWDGATYQLLKQRTQDDKGNWGRPDWFLFATTVPDSPEQGGPLMGSLGKRLDRAKLLAELHLVHGYEFGFQLRPTDGMELWRRPGGELRPLDELLAEHGLVPPTGPAEAAR